MKRFLLFFSMMAFMFATTVAYLPSPYDLCYMTPKQYGEYLLNHTH